MSTCPLSPPISSSCDLGLTRLTLQGPIKVTVQELDGSFNHMLQIEENSLKHDIPCHSKSRRYCRFTPTWTSYLTLS